MEEEKKVAWIWRGFASSKERQGGKDKRGEEWQKKVQRLANVVCGPT